MAGILHAETVEGVLRAAVSGELAAEPGWHEPVAAVPVSAAAGRAGDLGGRAGVPVGVEHARVQGQEGGAGGGRGAGAQVPADLAAGRSAAAGVEPVAPPVHVREGAGLGWGGQAAVERPVPVAAEHRLAQGADCEREEGGAHCGAVGEGELECLSGHAAAVHQGVREQPGQAEPAAGGQVHARPAQVRGDAAQRRERGAVRAHHQPVAVHAAEPEAEHRDPAGAEYGRVKVLSQPAEPADPLPGAAVRDVQQHTVREALAHGELAAGLPVLHVCIIF